MYLGFDSVFRLCPINFCGRLTRACVQYQQRHSYGESRLGKKKKKKRHEKKIERLAHWLLKQQATLTWAIVLDTQKETPQTLELPFSDSLLLSERQSSISTLGFLSRLHRETRLTIRSTHGIILNRNTLPLLACASQKPPPRSVLNYRVSYIYNVCAETVIQVVPTTGTTEHSW